MTQRDKDSLTVLLSTTKEIYQNITRQTQWTAENTAALDNLMHAKDLQKSMMNKLLHVSSKQVSIEGIYEIVPMFLAYKAWQRTKAVYSFNPELVADLSHTEDTNLYVSLIQRLPFKDMLFFLPEGALPKQKEIETAGIYVHIENHPENMWILFSVVDRMCGDVSQVVPGTIIGFPITDGMKISDVFLTPEYQKWQGTYQKMHASNSGDFLEERMLSERSTLNTAINLMYYLSSKNADIREVKHHKKKKSSPEKPKEEKLPAVTNHEVGGNYAEIVYRYIRESKLPEESPDEDSADNNEQTATRTAKSSKKKRPHARKAHWQHYWTGTGRTTLEVRWISDIFVGANREDQAVIVYDIAKKSLKGKQNPNASKKKQRK